MGFIRAIVSWARHVNRKSYERKRTQSHRRSASPKKSCLPDRVSIFYHSTIVRCPLFSTPPKNLSSSMTFSCLFRHDHFSETGENNGLRWQFQMPEETGVEDNEQMSWNAEHVVVSPSPPRDFFKGARRRRRAAGKAAAAAAAAHPTERRRRRIDGSLWTLTLRRRGGHFSLPEKYRGLSYIFSLSLPRPIGTTADRPMIDTDLSFRPGEHPHLPGGGWRRRASGFLPRGTNVLCHLRALCSVSPTTTSIGQRPVRRTFTPSHYFFPPSVPPISCSCRN